MEKLLNWTGIISYCVNKMIIHRQHSEFVSDNTSNRRVSRSTPDMIFSSSGAKEQEDTIFTALLGSKQITTEDLNRQAEKYVMFDVLKM